MESIFLSAAEWRSSLILQMTESKDTSLGLANRAEIRSQFEPTHCQKMKAD